MNVTTLGARTSRCELVRYFSIFSVLVRCEFFIIFVALVRCGPINANNYGGTKSGREPDRFTGKLIESSILEF